jgi:phytoene dehydrogenase-like protein
MARALRDYQSESATLRMNVALSELPDFTALPGRRRAAHHSSGIIMAPSLAFMDRAHASARERLVRRADRRDADPEHGGRFPRAAGAHVASLFCQHFRYALPDGALWDDERERAADAVIDQVTRFAPNFKQRCWAGACSRRSTSSASSASWAATSSTASFR